MNRLILKMILLNHHSWPSQSVWRCLFVQRCCSLTVFSYFLSILLWTVLCSPTRSNVATRLHRLLISLLGSVCVMSCRSVLCLTEGGATHIHTSRGANGRQNENCAFGLNSHRIQPCGCSCRVVCRCVHVCDTLNKTTEKQQENNVLFLWLTALFTPSLHSLSSWLDYPFFLPLREPGRRGRLWMVCF